MNIKKKAEQYTLNVLDEIVNDGISHTVKVEICSSSSYEKIKSALKFLVEAISLSDEEKAIDTVWPPYIRINVERNSYDGYYWYGDGTNCFRTDDPEFKSKIEKFLANDEFVSAPQCFAPSETANLKPVRKSSD